MPIGKPSIGTPRSAPADVQQAISNIRERLEAAEAAISAISGSSSVDLSGIQTLVSTLRNQLTALTVRVAALETENPATYYLGGVLVGTRPKLNIVAAGSLNVTAVDDSANDRVTFTFDVVGNLAIDVEPAALHIVGCDVALSIDIVLTPAALFVAGQDVTLT